jgi:hypothetical protein
VAIPHGPAAAPRPLPPDQALVDAVQAALGSYAWRSLTPTVVAALSVAAADRARGPRGSSGRPPAVLTPVARDDDRVAALVDELGSGPRWRELTLREVARRLVVELTAAEERSLWLDLELAWLLEPPA